MNMELEFLGMKLKSPFIVGSGPISYDAEGVIRAHNAGAGAVVTKTLRDHAAKNPYPHISEAGSSTLINAEKWTDIEPETWLNEEIPKINKEAKDLNLIVSLGHTIPEVKNWVEKIENAGVDAIEIVSYMENSIIEMVEIAKKRVDIPIILKVSPNWTDPVDTAVKAVEAGADAITVMDSVGPVLRININNAKPLVAGENGMGWMTGKGIRPIAQAIIAQLAQKVDVPIIGLGGVIKAEDAIEILMAGSTAVGICTTLLTHGIDYLHKLNDETEQLAQKLGYSNISEISRSALANLPAEENKEKFTFEFLKDKCIDCRRCVEVCPYQARELENMNMKLDEQRCRYCGLCASVCPTDALNIVY